MRMTTLSVHLSDIEDGGRVFSGQNATTPAYGSPRAPSPEVTEK